MSRQNEEGDTTPYAHTEDFPGGPYSGEQRKTRDGRMVWADWAHSPFARGRAWGDPSITYEEQVAYAQWAGQLGLEQNNTGDGVSKTMAALTEMLIASGATMGLAGAAGFGPGAVSGLEGAGTIAGDAFMPGALGAEGATAASSIPASLPGISAEYLAQGVGPGTLLTEGALTAPAAAAASGALPGGGTFSEAGSALELPTGSLPYDPANIPSNVGSALDANGEILKSAFPPSSSMQQLVDLGVPASTLQGLPQQVLQQIGGLGTQQLTKLAGLLAGGGALTGGTLSGGTSTLDSLMKYITAGGGILDWMERPDVIGASKTLLDSAINLTNKPYEPFSATTFKDNQNWQDYITALTAAPTARIRESAAQDKIAAKAKAAMSGQDITAYGALPGRPDIQSSLIDRSADDSIGMLTAGVTDKAFTNAMNQHTIGQQFPLITQQVGANTLKAAQPFGATSLGQLGTNVAGALGGGATPATGGAFDMNAWLKSLGTGVSATMPVTSPGTGALPDTTPYPGYVNTDDEITGSWALS